MTKCSRFRGLIAAGLITAITPSALAQNGAAGNASTGLATATITPARAGILSWQGFYVGLSAGFGLGRSIQNYQRAGDHGTAAVAPSGFLGSLSVGYNHLLGTSMLIGVEGDIGLMGLRQDDKEVFDGHVWKPAFGPLWGTLRARAGWLMLDNLLLYVTGGAAFMQTDNWTLGNTTPESSWDGRLRTGWVAGAGVEYALGGKWTVKAEYLFMDFGMHRGLSQNLEPYWYKDQVHMLRIGFTRHF